MVLLQVMIQSASGAGEVTAIGESQGLVSSAGFERRSRVVTATPNGTIATEIWWAWMPMYTDEGEQRSDHDLHKRHGCGRYCRRAMWGLGGSTGAYGLGDPFWDTNASLPGDQQQSSGGLADPERHRYVYQHALDNVGRVDCKHHRVRNPASPIPLCRWFRTTPLIIAPTLNFAWYRAARRCNGFEFMYSQDMLVVKRNCRVQSWIVARRAGRLAHDRRRHSGWTAAAAERRVGER